MTAIPDESHYNPIGSVHGSFFITVRTTRAAVLCCAVHSTLSAGVGCTSLEIKVSYFPDHCRHRLGHRPRMVTKRGKGVAFAGTDIRDRHGRVLATASSTCLIIHLDPDPAP